MIIKTRLNFISFKNNYYREHIIHFGRDISGLPGCNLPLLVDDHMVI